MRDLPEKDKKELLNHLLEIKKAAASNAKSFNRFRLSMMPFLSAVTKGSLGRTAEVFAIISEFLASALIMMAIIWISSAGEYWVKKMDSTPQDNFAYIFFQYADGVAIGLTCIYLTSAMMIYFYKSIKIKVLLANAEVARVKKDLDTHN